MGHYLVFYPHFELEAFLPACCFSIGYEFLNVSCWIPASRYPPLPKRGALKKLRQDSG